MAYNNIAILIDKYWDGTTSLIEEKQIKQFYLDHPQPLPTEFMELEMYRKHFESLGKVKEALKLDMRFDESLEAKIKAYEAKQKNENKKDTLDSEVFYTPSSANKSRSLDRKTPSKIRKLSPLLAIAASLLLFLMVGAFYQNMYNSQESNDKMAYVIINNKKIEDPEKAYQIAKASLGLVSKKIKIGNKQLMHLKKFNNTQHIFKSKK